MAGLAGLGIADIDAAIGDGRARDLMIETYRDFVRLNSANRAYGSFLSGVATASGAVVFHCTAGKDRTGWGAAVLQMVAGVPHDTIVAEYLASNEHVDGEYGPLVEAFGLAGGDAVALRHLVEVQADYLDSAVTMMMSAYGGIEGYVVRGLGLRQSGLSALADRLLD